MLKLHNQTEKHEILTMTYHEAVSPKATVFVSHAWKYYLHEVVNVLEKFSVEHPSDDLSFWFDLLIVDQWNAPTMVE